MSVQGVETTVGTYEGPKLTCAALKGQMGGGGSSTVATGVSRSPAPTHAPALQQPEILKTGTVGLAQACQPKNTFGREEGCLCLQHRSSACMPVLHLDMSLGINTETKNFQFSGNEGGVV